MQRSIAAEILYIKSQVWASCRHLFVETSLSRGDRNAWSLAAEFARHVY